ncbi:MAG: hypothetical protein J6332_00590 [Abditibacteriota bacterium]|nr:hypothetical protein [Abditibacteriota bacterium]
MASERNIVFLEEPRIGKPLRMVRSGKACTVENIKKIIRNDNEGTLKIVTVDGFTCVGKVDPHAEYEEEIFPEPKPGPDGIIDAVIVDAEEPETAVVTDNFVEQVETEVEAEITEENSGAAEDMPDFSKIFKEKEEIDFSEDSASLGDLFGDKGTLIKPGTPVEPRPKPEEPEPIIEIGPNDEIIMKDPDDPEDYSAEVKEAEKSREQRIDEELGRYLERAKSIPEISEEELRAAKAARKHAEEDFEPDVKVSVDTGDPEVIPEDYESDTFFKKEKEKPWLYRRSGFKLGRNFFRRFGLVAVKALVIAAIVSLMGYYLGYEPAMKFIDMNRTRNAYTECKKILAGGDSDEFAGFAFDEYATIIKAVDMDQGSHTLRITVDTKDWMMLIIPERHQIIINYFSVWTNLLQNRKVDISDAYVEIINEHQVKIAYARIAGAHIYKDKDILANSGYDPDTFFDEEGSE